MNNIVIPKKLMDETAKIANELATVMEDVGEDRRHAFERGYDLGMKHAQRIREAAR